MIEEKKIEHIPNEDKLFYHIPRNSFAPYFDFDEIPPGVFSPQGENLSVNWERYCSTAKDCLAIKTRAYPMGRTSETHGVGHFITEDVRRIASLDVEHAPSNTNYAHAHVLNIPPRKPKPPFVEMRKKLQQIFNSWDIRPDLQEEENE
jgi:hypothetical protein